MIVAENLVKRYGPVEAVKGVNFKVDKGEVVGFLGPNGAGKTTIMRILTTFLPPTSGKAFVAGYDCTEEALEVRRRIGYLPENPPLYLDMNTRDYLHFMGEIKGLKGKKLNEAVDIAAEKTKIADNMDKQIGHLSKGYRQRVGLAQAILHNPPLLILDEPTIGLDPTQVVEFRQLIKELAGESTILLSTHILPEASLLSDRVLIIHKGNILAEDTPEELAKKVKGTQTLKVAVGGANDEAVEKALSELEGVQAVIPEGEGKFRVEISKEEDIRGEIARLVVWRDWNLLELTPVGVTLEDIFMSLVTEEEV